MKIIDRYVFWSFLRNYLISFMVLIGMYIVLDMVFNFHDLVGLRDNADAGGASSVVETLRNIVDYYFYQAFLIFVHLSGIIPVVAAAFTLMRLSRFNELTALLAAGVPLLRVAMPIILAGVVVNVLVVVDQELVIPAMLPKLTRAHDDVRRTDVKSFPIVAMQASDKGLVYASRYTPASGDRPATIEYLDVIERGEAEDRRVVASVGNAGGEESSSEPAARRPLQPLAHIAADKAVWSEGEGRWDLFTWDPILKQFEPWGVRTTGLDPNAAVSTKQKVYAYQTNVTPEEIALYRSGDWVEMLSTSRISQLIERPGSYGQAHLFRVKDWRVTQPIMNVVLLLLAIPCVLTREPGKLKTAATKCLILTGLTMGSIFMMHQLAGNPPADPNWTRTWPALMAWLPVFVFGPLAVLLMDRVKT